MNKLISLIPILLVSMVLQVSYMETAKAQNFSLDSLNNGSDLIFDNNLGISPGSLTGGDGSNIIIDNGLGVSPDFFTGGGSGFPGGFPGGGNRLPEPIADLFRDITNIVGPIDTFLSVLGLEVDFGELGLPDFEKAYELFEQDNQIDIASDVFGTQTGSTVVIEDSLRKQYLKDLGNEYAQNSTLSEKGQENTAEQITLAQETAEISNQYAQDSNSQDVSQNILRNISNQIALQQQLDNMKYFGQQEDKIARSLMLAIQGESVVALDKITTTRDREAISIFKAGTYHQGLLSIPAQHLVPSN